MGKIILVVVNLFAIFAYNLFFGGDVTIEQSFPESIKAGESFTIEITIEKGDRSGFAKWQQTLPEGFVATAKETAGATFSFKNQDVKIIWMAIPEEESFTISYNVTTDAAMQGDFKLVGQFSYIQENQRKDISTSPKAISITNDTPILAANPNPIGTDSLGAAGELEKVDSSVIASNLPDPELKKDDDGVDPEAVPTEVEAIEIATPEGTVASDNGLIITRQIEPIEEAKYEVTLTITKGDLNSFGKVEDYLPPNYTATANKSMEGIYSFKKNVVKILWMTLPDENKITVSYIMESTSDELDSALIHGAFSYLDGDDSRQLKLNPTKFENTFVPVLAEEPELEEELAEEIPEVIVVEEPEIVEEPAVEEVRKEEVAKEITNIPAPEASVRYKVQIAAGKREVNQQYFIDRHNITEPVTIQFHETWYKYTIGGYDVYKEARDKRNAVWATDNKISDAFVTAYNAGERISVQEALMISQQKWFK
ncbi:MAG: hypothetical protein RJQ00_08870 [Vicingaceae bacterium]